MNKRILVLLVILFLASFLRLYKLGVVPPSPDWDEAALGYNAYSILKTGKDEYGTTFPLSIRSFDDYKPPLYTYLTIPSVAIFGLSTFSTRLPSAIMGILAVLGTYFMVRELFRNRHETMSMGQKRGKFYPDFIDFRLSTFDLPTIAMLLLAISPWHLQFSRIAFEANSGITLNIWAVTAFLLGLRKKIFLSLSAFLFGLGLYAYHSERVFLPLLLCLLIVLYRSKLFCKENRKIVIVSVITGCIVIAPLVSVVFNKSAMLRLRGTSSFTDQTNLLSRNIAKLEQDKQSGDRFGELLDNRRIVWAKTIIAGYLSHFSLKWLFLTGDNPRHHAPDMGLLYLWELPFLFYGIYVLLKTKSYKQEVLVLLGWLVIAPVAASPTTGLPHAIRTLVFLPVFQIFTAVGILVILQWTKNREQKAISNKQFCFLVSVFWFLFSGFCLFNIAYYFNQYYTHQNIEVSEHWQYGYKEAVELTEKIKSKYEKVVVSTNLEQSYMFFLFYTTYDPVRYLANGGTKSGGFAEVKNQFDAYEFRTIDWSREKRDGSILYVGAPSDMPHGNVANITFLNGKPAIEIADQPNGAP